MQIITSYILWNVLSSEDTKTRRLGTCPQGALRILRRDRNLNVQSKQGKVLCGGPLLTPHRAWHEGGGCLAHCRSLDSLPGGEGIELRLEGALEGRKNQDERKPPQRKDLSVWNNPGKSHLDRWASDQWRKTKSEEKCTDSHSMCPEISVLVMIIDWCRQISLGSTRLDNDFKYHESGLLRAWDVEAPRECLSRESTQPFPNSLGPDVSKWLRDQLHQPHLEACWKCRICILARSPGGSCGY